MVLVPDTERRGSLMLYRTVLPHADGAFSISDVAPGVYKPVAREGAADPAWMSTSFLSAFEEAGVAVDIMPDVKVNATVPVNW